MSHQKHPITHKNAQDESTYLKTLSKQRLLFQLPPKLERQFKEATEKQRVAMYQLAYPSSVFISLVLGLLLVDFNRDSGENIVLHCWLGVLFTYSMGYLFFLHPTTKSHYNIYHGSMMILVIGLVTAKGMQAKTLSDQVSIFFLLGYYYISTYVALRFLEAIGWCFSCGIFSLVACIFMEQSIHWTLFYLYFGFSNFIGILIGYHTENLARHSYLNYRLHRYSDNLSLKDSLTQLPNRRYFDQAYIRLWQQCKDQQTPISILFIDIDEYKKYNDCYGHQKGDQCLITLANIFSQNITRQHDVVARYGGEEFVAILPNTDEYNACHVAKRLHKAVNKNQIEHPASSTGNYLTISIGIASCYPHTYLSSKELVQQADKALYRAKALGRNQYHSVNLS